ncbi:unnamed protein product [Parnassius mnemosyne]|uniref:Uncharacterized protein n=1 Tax=Parnassius mnemosyne TaxID=213953 RepID=A0AAV1KCQ5_9NEOP
MKFKHKRLGYSNNTYLKTINGVKKASGIITLDVNIFNVERKMDVFVIDQENFDHDFLIGLDCIKKFYLIQNENLEISQKVPIQKKIIKNSETNNVSKETITKRLEIDNISKEMKNKESENEIIRKEIKFENSQNDKKNLINFNEYFNKENFIIWINHLDIDKQAIIDDLITKNKSVFAKDKYDIGTVKDYEAHIDLLAEKYCSKRPYRCTIEDKKEIEQQIAQLLKRNLIEESYSPFAAPVTLAYKKRGKHKIKIVYRFSRPK